MSRFDDLSQAIDRSDLAGVKRLLAEDPALAKSCDYFGITPLMRAVSSCDRELPIIQAILDAGADVNRQTSEGYTALHCAIDVDGDARSNAAEVLGLLVSEGANLNLRQHYGWTPLLDAVVEGGAAEVSALLAAGADPNDTLPHETLPAFNSGRTTLMAALTNRDAEKVVSALLVAGANPLMLDAHGITFFDYADLIVRESGDGDLSDKVKRCAAIARQGLSKDA